MQLTFSSGVETNHGNFKFEILLHMRIVPDVATASFVLGM